MRDHPSNHAHLREVELALTRNDSEPPVQGKPRHPREGYRGRSGLRGDSLGPRKEKRRECKAAAECEQEGLRKATESSRGSCRPAIALDGAQEAPREGVRREKRGVWKSQDGGGKKEEGRGLRTEQKKLIRIADSRAG